MEMPDTYLEFSIAFLSFLAILLGTFVYLYFRVKRLEKFYRR
jgi:hypothetical protein